ncbi:phosphate ABC transporter substrate-binding protein [Aliikangiella sp. G2MR2-5]|uniref:phosphate ABC transporter substrate-binding protein n=1 Tax=Aliikangiella sp. G2MR2-5 TaxID=2788943 RepID=UPI0018AA914B|nr:phosphate ABC transporter substrate-binding protein [Aliikangiella sp. G2MR2-5]
MKFVKLVITLCALFYANNSFADVAIIVHPSNNSTLSNTDLARLFLGKMKSFPGGGSATPINLSEGDAAADEFNQKVLKKSASQLKAYWSKLIFTGKGTPPESMATAQEVKKAVASNPDYIGYINASDVDDSVKVIARF